MTIDSIKEKIITVINKYPIKRIVLFGSVAAGTNTDDSDVDLIVEFYDRISLMQLSELKIELEELLNVPVDIVHGPIRETDMIEIGKTVELYAA